MFCFSPQTAAVDEATPADVDNGAADDEGNLKHRNFVVLQLKSSCTTRTRTCTVCLFSGAQFPFLEEYYTVTTTRTDQRGVDLSEAPAADEKHSLVDVTSLNSGRCACCCIGSIM